MVGHHLLIPRTTLSQDVWCSRNFDNYCLDFFSPFFVYFWKTETAPYFCRYSIKLSTFSYISAAIFAKFVQWSSQNRVHFLKFSFIFEGAKIINVILFENFKNTFKTLRSGLRGYVLLVQECAPEPAWYLGIA